MIAPASRPGLLRQLPIKFQFIVLLVDCGLLPITVSLRGGFCRRGNLPVLSYEIIAVKIEVLANNVPYFVYFSASNILPRDCHVASLLAMTYFYLFG